MERELLMFFVLVVVGLIVLLFVFAYKLSSLVSRIDKYEMHIETQSAHISNITQMYNEAVLDTHGSNPSDFEQFRDHTRVVLRDSIVSIGKLARRVETLEKAVSIQTQMVTPIEDLIQ